MRTLPLDQAANIGFRVSSSIRLLGFDGDLVRGQRIPGEIRGVDPIRVRGSGHSRAVQVSCRIPLQRREIYPGPGTDASLHFVKLLVVRVVGPGEGYPAPRYRGRRQTVPR